MSFDNTLVEITKKIHNICENTKDFTSYYAKKHTNDGFTNWSKTQEGLILYYSYGSVNSLITPYGELKLIGSCSSHNNALQELHNILVNTFDLQLYKDIVETDYGCYGPWYSITSFNGKQLVYPKLIQQNTYLDYYECKKKYTQLFGDYFDD